MFDICSNQEGAHEILDANIGVNTTLLKAYVNIANEHIKKIEHKVNMLAAGLGLQSMANGNIARNSAAIKCQSDACNLVCETHEKTKGATYTTTGLVNILEKLPTDSSEVFNSLIALQEFVAAMKNIYKEMLSLADNLQEKKNSFSEISQKQR